MPSLNELGLTEDSAPQVDWDAPEAGSAPPAVYPGIYTLQFKLPEDVKDWFETQTVNTVKNDPKTAAKFLVIRAVPAILQVHKDASGNPLREAAGIPVPMDEVSGLHRQMPPQRISFFKNAKMPISRGGELLRAMGVRLEGSLLAQIEQTLQQLNGRATFVAELGWRAYFKSTDTTVSTHPRKKAGELRWPKAADGNFELLAVNPQNGQKAFGYLEIMSIFAPTPST
jgi:hypothetical protein